MPIRSLLASTATIGLLALAVSGTAKAELTFSGTNYLSSPCSTPGNCTVGTFVIGYGAPGTLTVTGGNAFTSNDNPSQIGQGSGGDGTVTVTGTGSALNLGGGSANFYAIGASSGKGTLVLGNGATYTQNAATSGTYAGEAVLAVGHNLGTGTVLVQSGSTMTIQDTGTNTMDDGIQLGGTRDVAGGPGSLVVTGSGSALNITGHSAYINVGRNGAGNTGSLTVTDGASATLNATTGEASFSVGRGNGAIGTAVISGTNTRMSVVGTTGAFARVGRTDTATTGTLTVQSGAQLTIQSSWGDADLSATRRSTLDSGSTAGNGTIRISGGTVSVSTQGTSGTAYVIAGNDAGGKGEIIVENGGTLTLDGGTYGNARVRIGNNAGSNGSLTVTGSGSKLTLTTAYSSAANNIGIGMASGSTGALAVQNGGTVTVKNGVFVAHDPNATGSVTVSGSGSLLNAGQYFTISATPIDSTLTSIQAGGSGSAIVSDGGELRANLIMLGTSGGDASKAKTLSVLGNGTVTAGTIYAFEGGAINNSGTITGSVILHGGSLTNAPTSGAAASSAVISASSGSTVQVASTTSALANSGTIQASGTGAAAVNVQGTIAGALSNSGTIQSTSGTGILIGAEGTITGGIVNTATGTISGGNGVAIDNSASTTALAITNAGTITGAVKFGSGGDNLRLTGGAMNGAVTGQNNRGTVAFDAGSSGTASLGGSLSGLSAVTWNSGSVSVGSGGGISASSGSALVVPTGSTVAGLTNAGTIGSTAGAAITVAQGATVSGTIANAATGTISGGNGIAIDASASSSPLAVSNAGTITGDIRFGSSSSSLSVTGGTITGNLSAAGGGLTFNPGTGGTAALTGSLSNVGALAVNSGTVTLGSDIASGSVQSLSVSGSGTDLRINGSTRGVTLSCGGLLALGGGATLTADRVTIGSGGTVSGIGSITGSLQVSGGRIVPGASPGTLAIGGNLSASNSTFLMEVGGTGSGQSDLIAVGGTAAITNSTVSVSLVNGYQPEEGDRITVLTAAGGVTEYSGNTLTVTNAPAGAQYSVTPGTTPGGGLTFTAMNDFLLGNTAAQSLEQAGETIAESSLRATRRSVVTTIQNRLQVLRKGSGFRMAGAPAGTAAGLSGVSAGDGDLGIGFWADANFNRINAKAPTTGDSDVSGLTQTLMFGVDRVIGQSAVVGGTVNLEAGNMSLSGPDGNQRSFGGGFTLYAGYAINDLLSVDALAGYGRITNSIDQLRRTRVVSGSYGSNRAIGAVNLNAETTLDNWVISGALGVSYSYEGLESYTASNGSTVDSSVVSMTVGRIGGEIGYQFERFTPYANLAVEQDLVSNQPDKKTGLIIGGGIRGMLTDITTIGAAVSSQVLDNGDQTLGMTLNVRTLF